MSTLFILVQRILPQHLLSRVAGALAGSRISAVLIPLFIRRYQVNMEEAEHRHEHYKSFHQFFTRALSADARKKARATLVSPCDGTIADLGQVRDGLLIQAKQHSYNLASLCADPACKNIFADGNHMTIYLSPRDYHRVHFPCDARLIRWRYVPGRLFSVNRITARHLPELYARNERLVCHCDSRHGQFMLIMVGAMLVSGIVSQWHGKHRLARDSGWQDEGSNWKKLDQLGTFCFGSTVILVTEQSMSPWHSKLCEDETVLLGQALTTNKRRNNE